MRKPYRRPEIDCTIRFHGVGGPIAFATSMFLKRWPLEEWPWVFSTVADGRGWL